MDRPGTQGRQSDTIAVQATRFDVIDAAHILGPTVNNLLDATSGRSPEMAVRLEQTFMAAHEWLIRPLHHQLAELMRRADHVEGELFHAPAHRRASDA